jgi:hypothetical protein
VQFTRRRRLQYRCVNHSEETRKVRGGLGRGRVGAWGPTQHALDLVLRAERHIAPGPSPGAALHVAAAVILAEVFLAARNPHLVTAWSGALGERPAYLNLKIV